MRGQDPLSFLSFSSSAFSNIFISNLIFMKHSSNTGAATVAAVATGTVMAILVLTLSASNCNAASLSPSSFGNETDDAAATSMWCNSHTEECLVGEDDVGDYSAFPSLAAKQIKFSGRTGDRSKPICDRPGRYDCLGSKGNIPKAETNSPYKRR